MKWYIEFLLVWSVLFVLFSMLSSPYTSAGVYEGLPYRLFMGFWYASFIGGFGYFGFYTYRKKKRK